MDFIIRLAAALLLFMAGRKIITVIDTGMNEESKRHKYALPAAILFLVLISFISHAGGVINALLAGVFWGALTLAAYCDYLTTEIYDFVYFPAVVTCALQMKINGVTLNLLIELFLFCMLQLFIFRLMYGMSDCFAFILCAAFLTVAGGGLVEYFLHMTVAYVLLIVMQICKKNVTIKGKLKEPVAFIPYITASMVIMQFIG